MQLFDELVDEIRSDVITVGENEARANTWAVSLTDDQAAKLSPNEVASFLDQARAAYAASATTVQRNMPLRFYAWFDELAGQLRFSVSSIDPLPFGAPIRVVAESQKIGRQFLTGDYLSGIPWSEFRQVEDNDGFGDLEVGEDTLDVFVVSRFSG